MSAVLGNSAFVVLLHPIRQCKFVIIRKSPSPRRMLTWSPLATLILGLKINGVIIRPLQCVELRCGIAGYEEGTGVPVPASLERLPGEEAWLEQPYACQVFLFSGHIIETRSHSNYINTMPECVVTQPYTVDGFALYC